MFASEELESKTVNNALNYKSRSGHSSSFAEHRTVNKKQKRPELKDYSMKGGASAIDEEDEEGKDDDLFAHLVAEK